MKIKVWHVVVYVIATLFTFHQATYWGYGAASAPPGNPSAREHCLTMYSIYGISFLVLLAVPLIFVLCWLVLKLGRRLKSTLPAK